jgi:predicted Rdx family selenoprotein
MSEDNDPTDHLMVMDIYRLARDGGYQTAAALKKAIRDAYPNEPQERLDKNLAELARLLLRNQGLQ